MSLKFPFLACLTKFGFCSPGIEVLLWVPQVLIQQHQMIIASHTSLIDPEVLSGVRSYKGRLCALPKQWEHFSRHQGSNCKSLIDSAHICLIYIIQKDSLNGDVETALKS